MPEKRKNAKPILTLRREDPPPPSSFGPKAGLTEVYADEFAKIKADPGNWYALLDYGERAATAASAANRLKKQVVGFETLARNGVLYVRYVGTTS